jgi:hypothetical protein
MKNPVNPSTANPATPNPLTVPPPKDTFKACGKLVDCLCGSYICFSCYFHSSMFPANAEKKAPKQKL